MIDKDIEAEIQAKGKTAPRITPQMLEDEIVGEVSFRASQAFSRVGSFDVHKVQKPNPPDPLQCLTICILTTRNGFTLVGTSACASPENYDEALGHKIARQKAIEQLWPLMGYELKTKLADAEWLRKNFAAG